MLNTFISWLGYIEEPLCQAGDFLCQMTSGTNTLTDYIPDAVEPAVLSTIDAVDQNRLLSLTLTGIAAAGSYALWQYRNKRNQYLAKASGYFNNCGLHCIINTLLALPEEQIKVLFNKYLIFQEILQSFSDYYGLPGCDLDTFLQLCQVFKHPYDREALLGQVFRRVLQLRVPENEFNEVTDGNFIPDDLLRYLTQEMGATLTVHNTRGFQSVQRAVTYQPNDRASWHIDLHHNGNHYDFKYPRYAQSTTHNQERGNFTNCLLVDAITAPRDQQKGAIIEKVQIVYLQLTNRVEEPSFKTQKGWPY